MPNDLRRQDSMQSSTKHAALIELRFKTQICTFLTYDVQNVGDV